MQAKLHAKLCVLELLRMTTIADRFLQVRGKIKQGEFAKALGINPNTLRNYENGRVLPNQEILERICTQFSVSPRWLLLGEGAMIESGEGAKIDFLVGQVDTSRLTPQKQEWDLSHVLAKLEKTEGQRDDLIEENRQLHRENASLLRENGTLREKLARLEAERGKRRSEHEEGDFSSLFDENHTTSSSRTAIIRK